MHERMTMEGMPHKEGMFQTLKGKVDRAFANGKEWARKNFTVEGNLQKQYENNAQLVEQVMQSVPEKDRAAAAAQIEATLKQRAKIDVMAHWGAATLVTGAVTFGGFMMNDKFRGRVENMGWAGKKLASGAEKTKGAAKGLIDKITHFNWKWESKTARAVPNNLDSRISAIQGRLGVLKSQKKDVSQEVQNLTKELGELRVQRYNVDIDRVQRQADVLGNRVDANVKKAVEIRTNAKRQVKDLNTANAALRQDQENLAWAKRQLNKRPKP